MKAALRMPRALPRAACRACIPRRCARSAPIPFASATNAREFLRQAERALGFPIDVIGGHEEARLIYLGVAHVLPPSTAPRLVIDIGGGSTEFIIGRGLEPERLESLKIGCVGFYATLLPQGTASPPTALDAAETRRGSRSKRSRSEFGPGHWRDAYASSGTAAALAEILEQNGFSAGGITPVGPGAPAQAAAACRTRRQAHPQRAQTRARAGAAREAWRS